MAGTIVLLSFMSRRKHYEKGKRGRKNGKDQRDRGSHWKDKINLVVAGNSSSKTSVYQHIIYRSQQKLIVLE